MERSNWSVSQFLPVFNLDRKFYTPTFVLKMDKVIFKSKIEKVWKPWPDLQITSSRENSVHFFRRVYLIGKLFANIRNCQNPSNLTDTAWYARRNSLTMKKYSLFLSSILNPLHTLIKCSKVNSVKTLTSYAIISAIQQTIKTKKERFNRKQRRFARRPKRAKWFKMLRLCVKLNLLIEVQIKQWDIKLNHLWKVLYHFFRYNWF